MPEEQTQGVSLQDPVNGGVYRWQWGLREQDKITLLIKGANNLWNFYGVRPDDIHNWSSGAEDISFEQAKNAIVRGTFIYIGKLGDIFYGR